MQFNRKAELIIGKTALSYDEFDFEFDVEFDDTSDLNHAEIKVYNLSNSRVKSIKNNAPIIINAGYEGDTGSVFIGAIYDVKSIRVGVDRETIIQAIDASNQRGRLNINRSYKAGTRASQIITDLCRLSGLSIGSLSLRKDVQYRNGKNVSGKPLVLLKNIAKDGGSKFKITKGLAYFRKPGEGQSVRFLFNSDRGLIGSPEPFEREEDEKVIKGYNVNTLLNHRVQENSIIEIQSRTAKGKYRVIKGNHTFTSGEMITEMEVV